MQLVGVGLLTEDRGPVIVGERFFHRFAFVLFHGIFDRLLDQAVFQLKSRHRQPIDEGAQIQRSLAFLPAVAELPGDAEPVGPVAGHGLKFFRQYSQHPGKTGQRTEHLWMQGTKHLKGAFSFGIGVGTVAGGVG